MICPACGTTNLMGLDACTWCGGDLSAFDRPQPADAVEAALVGDTVASLRPRPPVCVPPTADLGRAMQVMTAEGVGAVLVTDAAGQLVGILTERDFLTRIAGSDALALLPVFQFMTPHPETVRPDDPLAFAVRLMDVGGYRHLPVVDGGRPVGVISVRDVLRHVLDIVRPRAKVRG
ncbi:MAG: CBS domain-containing protein [Fimbriiglobus sp.]|jgi:CBS domain-containing protein|nr:CBS domain-containing protein [Fimbriiglobus sp.]